MIRVLIVATYASVRAGLHALLLEYEDMEVLGEVSGSAELERVLSERNPDVILCDVNEGENARLRDALSGGDVGLVLLGEGRDLARSMSESDLPGWACLRREAESAEIAGALRAVAAGLIALDPIFLPRWSAPLSENTEDALPGETLTAREREVLQLLSQGLPNKTVAARLGISQHTVKFHVASILAKLGATSRTEAVTIGARRGYILL